MTVNEEGRPGNRVGADGHATDGGRSATRTAIEASIAQLDVMRADETLEEFLHHFPSVRRAQSVAAPEYDS